MAKRGTLDHPKTKRLGRQIGMPAWAALGLLEALWHWVGRYRPNGLLSAEDLEDCAETLRYESGDKLRADLCACGWLDECGDSWYIHDWHDHADDTVKKTLSKRKESFASGDPVRKPVNREPFANDSRVIRDKPEPEPEPEPVVNTELQTGGNRESERELQNWREIVGALSALLPDATRRDPITQTALEEWARYAPERHAKRWPRATIEATAAMLSGLAPPGIRDSIKEAIQANSCHLRPPRSTPRQATTRRSATATYERLSQ